MAIVFRLCDFEHAQLLWLAIVWHAAGYDGTTAARLRLPHPDRPPSCQSSMHCVCEYVCRVRERVCYRGCVCMRV